MKQQPKSLRNELLQMRDVDQAMRNKYRPGDKWDDSIDRHNTKRMKEIIDTNGWPTISQVGKDGAQAAWILVQHADHDVDFQRHCLTLMKALPADEVDRIRIGYLEDRVLVGNGEEQLYGTQFHTTNGQFGPWPIRDAERLDERRRELGMKLFSEYEQEMRALSKQ